MKLDEIVAWYQKKIGTYDKQQWEKTVEQRILYGFIRVPLKNTTLKTELIDVDLVRGSSFPKAKPKQSLLTVLRLSVLRFLLLPLYAKWWCDQTTPKIFTFFLCIYLVQMFNWGVYSYNIHRIGQETTEHKVSLSELLIPIALSMILSVIHSQIVATANITKDEKRRQRHDLHQKTKRKKRERVKRRKRNQRLRSTVQTITPTTNDNKLSQQPPPTPSTTTTTTLTATNLENIDSNKYNKTLNKQQRSCLSSTTNNILDLRNNLNNDIVFNKKTDSLEQQTQKTFVDECDLLIPPIIDQQLTTDSCTTKNIQLNMNEPSTSLRKRNVNWGQVLSSNIEQNIYLNDEIINNELNETGVVNVEINDVDEVNDLVEKTDDLNDGIKDKKDDDDDLNDNINIIPVNDNNNLNNNVNNEQTGDDDGFESLNGKSSSGEENLIENPNIFNNFNVDNVTNQQQQQINKIPYRNTWIRDILENTNKMSGDSDTDTLKGNNSSATILSRKNSLSLPLTNFKSNNNNNNNTNMKPKIIISSLELDNTNEKNRKKLNKKTYSGTTTSTTNLLKNQQTNNFLNILPNRNSSSDDDDCDDDVDEDCETISTPGTNSNTQFTEGTTSGTEWIGVTTNSDDCSYSSQNELSDSQNEFSGSGVDYDFTPAYILNPVGVVDRISCTIWEHREPKKAEMSVLDISSAIIEKVEGMPETCDYIYIGLTFSIVLSFIPAFCRLCEAAFDITNSTEVNFLDIPVLLLEKASFSSTRLLWLAFGDTNWERTILVVSFFLRLCLTFLFFFLLTVAERTFKQRFLYAKLFSHLTSSRRARKSELPHFRLNKVRNIKTWLSVRSYLKRRGPQRSIDVIISAAFMLTLLLLAFLSVEFIKDSVHLHSQFNLEALVWSSSLGIFLLRFMTLGTKINRKYRSISVLITEQINLYLQIEQKPHKKEELMVSNSVLKLAADLLKELESPFKISGLSANPYLYTTIKVVILSALSGVLSEILGFKLKLHKIKIK